MFFSLNKKIVYCLLVFLLLIISIFFMIFINFYAQNLQDNQNSIYIRNQYVVSLLYDNIQLRKTIMNLTNQYPKLQRYLNKEQKEQIFGQKVDAAEKELTREQKLNEELRRNYDKNREATKVGAEIIGISLFVILLMILLLFFLLDHWVIHPIKKMTFISNKVSEGILSSRIEKKQTGLVDEFSILYSTFNQMLDSMEQNVENVKQRERFLQQLVDAMPDAIRVLDKEYKVIMENNAFKKLINQKKSCIGRKCFEAYGYKHEKCPRSLYNCPIAHLKQPQNDVFHAIHEINRTPVHINASRLFLGKRKKDDYYIIETMHDLSSEVQFSHQQKISSLAFLSTSIAHEIKNNLGAVRMILEGIMDGKTIQNLSNEEKDKYLMLMHRQLVDTVQIPERLLKMAQYVENEVTEIDIKNSILDTVQMIDYSAKRLGIEVGLSLEDGLYLSGNEADFKMILLNLAQNAVKAMPNGGELNFSCLKKSSKVIIKIMDTGIGIDKERIKHIFEPFYSGNEKARSSGLGLAIVSNLVNKFKGKISVESQVEQGTIFTLEFSASTSGSTKK